MSLDKTAEHALLQAQKHGATECSVYIERRRSVGVQLRDGRLEDVKESASASMSVELFVDGRYSTHRTSDLRDTSAAAFLERSVQMTRLLQPDEHRGLADPSLYPTDARDLRLFDEQANSVTIQTRKEQALALFDSARQVQGPIVSITSGFQDTTVDSVRIHSNGLRGKHRMSQFSYGSGVTCDDPTGRKPNDYYWVQGRWLNELPDAASIGKKASARAVRRLGQRKLPTGTYTVVIENRALPRLLGHALRPLSGRSLHHKRSFWLGRKGETVASPAFTVLDDPLLPAGLGSRKFDGDGIASHKRALFKHGVLESFLVDVYFGRKLGLPPNGGSTSNLSITPGNDSLEALISSVGDGVLVTGFQGGNSDSTRGDFSHGISGFAIRKGQLEEPVGEMNIAGNHSELWKRLVAVGNDPYAFSRMRTPSVVLENVTLSGG